jgi:hypothetical protein
MNCYEHPEIFSVSTCPDCGVGLCQSCTGRYMRPICSRCNATRVAGDEGNLGRDMRNTFIAGLIGAIGITAAYLTNCKGISCVTLGIPTAIVGFIGCACVPIGWRGLRNITPRTFFFIPYLTWAAYYGIKFGLSLPVGIVLLPRELMRWKRKLAENKENRASTDSYRR